MKRVRSRLFVFPISVCLTFGAGVLAWASASEGKVVGFPEMSGWKSSGEVQTFTPKTLYEYIDGAADLYLSYDFQELRVAEYLNERKASVIVEIYRHQTPADAFGIYSRERLPDADVIETGAQGYIEENVLNFVTESYYVKINSFKTGKEDREILLTFAKRVAESLGEKGWLPSLLSSFPPEGKKRNSEKYISKNFLGYSFLHSAFTADYELSGMKFKLFLIEGEGGNDCRDMIQKYLQQTGSPKKEISEGSYTVADPYNGEIGLNWQGNYIWGILNLGDPSLRSKYLGLLEKELVKRK